MKGTYKSHGMPERCPDECKKSCYLQYVYLFLSWISFPVWNPSICFRFWQGTQLRDKAIQFSDLLSVFFLPKWLSVSHRDQHYNVCQNMFKTWSCKNRNQVCFFEGSINYSYILGSWRFQLNRFKVIVFFLQWKKRGSSQLGFLKFQLHQLLQTLPLISPEQLLPKTSLHFTVTKSTLWPFHYYLIKLLIMKKK